MDTEKLGFELAEAIMEMVHESLDDIRSTLRKPSQNVLLEYIALLLWIAVKQASVVLPKESIQSTIDHAHGVTFSFLDDAGCRKIKMLGGYFNEKTFEDYICARFKLYYWAWKAFPKPDDFSRAEKAQASEIVVARYFAVSCFGGETEFREVFPTAEADIALVEQILYPFHRFSERIKSILSRFDSNQEQTSINV